jgi:hypothetical protein
MWYYNLVNQTTHNLDKQNMHNFTLICVTDMLRNPPSYPYEEDERKCVRLVIDRQWVEKKNTAPVVVGEGVTSDHQGGNVSKRVSLGLRGNPNCNVHQGKYPV